MGLSMDDPVIINEKKTRTLCNVYYICGKKISCSVYCLNLRQSQCIQRRTQCSITSWWFRTKPASCFFFSSSYNLWFAEKVWNLWISCMLTLKVKSRIWSPYGIHLSTIWASIAIFFFMCWYTRVCCINFKYLFGLY